MPIAVAAVKAGFDCREWHHLERLITAVKNATTYSDTYFGTGHYQSSIYPGSWKPDTVRPQDGVVETYQNAAIAPYVPAFSRTAEEIVQDHSDPNQEQGEPTSFTLVDDRATKTTTGTDREPRGERFAGSRINTGETSLNLVYDMLT